MSDVEKKYHGSRVWRVDPYTSIKNIAIREIADEGDQFQYLVFNFPYKHLRSGATSFADFKASGRASSFCDVFLLFLKLVQELCTSGSDTISSHCACFLETVQYHEVSIGVRVWVFSNRKETPVHGNLINIITGSKDSYAKMQKKTPKSVVKLATHEGHLKCKSLHDYLQFVSTYTNSEQHLQYSEDIQMKIRNADCAAGPARIFSIDSPGFRYNFGSLVENNFDQNDPLMYYEDMQFQFPNEKLVLRVSPEQITIEELFLKKKYLPSYFFEKVRLPSVKVTEVEDEDLGNKQYIVKVPAHIHAMKKIESVPLKTHLERHNENNNDDIFHYSQSVYHNVVEPLMRQVFVVTYMKNDSDVAMYKDDGVAKFLKYQQKYETKDELSDFWFTDILTDEKKDPSVRSLLADKHSLDTLDMLRYKYQIMSEYEADKEAIQKQFVDELVRTVVNDANGDVSEPMKNMLHWFNHVYDPKKKIIRKKTDIEGSVHLNSIIWKLNFFDEDLQVSTGHPVLMLLQHAKYDAYRQQLNLHLNLIFTGEGATSKSFLFDKMKQMSIHNTVTELTYTTKRAMAVEKDQNDEITVFNEAPAGLFMSNGGKLNGGDIEAEAAFKEKLTSQTTSCLTWMKDEENDKRTNRKTMSQAIGCYFGATNDDPSAASEAMSTRFYWGEFEKVERKNKTIDQCMRGEKEWADVGKDALEKSLHFFHLEHFQMMLLFKCMFIGILRYPTLDVSDFIYEQINRSLKGQKIETSTRFKERYDIMCMIFTMTNALDTVYNYEGGKHANMEKFDAATLIDCEPYLYCTEEIAIFCFTLLSNEIYNPSEQKILKAVWKLWNVAGGNAFEKVVTEETGVGILHNYIKINRTGRKLITSIQQSIPSHSGRPSEHNIKAVLKKLKNKTFPIYDMVSANTLARNHQVYRDGKPERAVDAIARKHGDGLREDSDSYFNIELFDKLRRKEDVNPIMKAVDNCRHKYTVPKKIIFGCPTRKNGVIQYPSVFQVMYMKPNASKVLRRRNPLFKTQASIRLRQSSNQRLTNEELYKGMVLKADFDNWGCLQHAKKIKVSSREWKDFFTKYGHTLVEDRIASYPADRRINYPDDVIKGYEERHRQDPDASQAEEESYVDTYDDFNFEEIIRVDRLKRVRVE